MKRPDPILYQKEGLLIPDLRVDLVKFRQRLKPKLLSRDLVCRGCGEGFEGQPHMHEGIISRNDVVGWPKRWRKLIHCELNCVLLCWVCNLALGGKSPPAQAQIWAEHCERYGEDVMRAWLDSLPFKIPPRF